MASAYYDESDDEYPYDTYGDEDSDEGDYWECPTNHRGNDDGSYDSDDSPRSYDSYNVRKGRSEPLSPTNTGEPHIFCATEGEFEHLVVQVVSDMRKTEEQLENDPFTKLTDFPDIVKNPIKYTDVLENIKNRVWRDTISLREKLQILDYLIKLHEKYEERDPTLNVTPKFLEANITATNGKIFTLAEVENTVKKYLAGRTIRQSEYYIILKYILICNDREERRQEVEKEAARLAEEAKCAEETKRNLIETPVVENGYNADKEVHKSKKKSRKSKE